MKGSLHASLTLERSGWYLSHIPMEVTFSFLSGEPFGRLRIPLDAELTDLAWELKAEAMFQLGVSRFCAIRVIFGADQLAPDRLVARSIFGDKAYLFMVPKGYKSSPQEAIDAWLVNPFVREWQQ